MPRSLHDWLRLFHLDGALEPLVFEVVRRLPRDVVDDLVADPHFRICDFDPFDPRAAVAVAVPTLERSGRSIALKRTLVRRPLPFAHYVIAHEFAHAHLRNEGRWDGDDPERAADALAAAWGFPRPDPAPAPRQSSSG
jgi:hypothetical protein